MNGAHKVSLWRWEATQSTEAQDLVAVEEPLEIQLMGAQIAVVMRTPGHDLDLVRGFLVTELVIEDAGQIRSIAHCETAPDPEAEDNVVRVILHDDVELDLDRLRRNLYATSSCGVCGKATIENAMRVGQVVDDDTVFSAQKIYQLPRTLREYQSVFAATGGLHGAALVDVKGEVLCVREDVGRHNAVDKAIGWALSAGRVPLRGTALIVSGRVSFEIVQKAAAAGVPIVCAISAPTSLAIRTAEALGITLVGFLRAERANVYVHPERVR